MWCRHLCFARFGVMREYSPCWRDRRDELRRKILVRVIVVAKVEDKSFDEKVLRGRLDRALTSEDDLVLFGLGAK